jgi:NitT/TauT family transport system permease protein
MTEYAIGMSLAATSGVLAGLLLGQLPWLRRAVDPVLAAFYSTPTVALAPIFILWFGIELESKVMIVWYVAVLPIIVVTATGFANVDPAYIDVARVFRTPRWRMFTEVLVPAAMPSVIGGIRIGSGVGLIGVILGEFFGSQAGLGYLVLYATNRFDLALMLLGVISLAVIGIVIAALLRVLEHRWAG